MCCNYKCIRLSSRPTGGRRVLAIGNFDGVHRGHRELITRTSMYAKEHGLEASVLTFDPHPQEFLHPGHGPKLIMEFDEKLECLASFGIDTVLVQRFDQEFADMEPERFAWHLHEEFAADYVVVGFNYTFGKFGKGKAEDLFAFGKQLGFDVEIVEAQTMKGATISSTRIREAIASGNALLAEALLGHA